MTITKNPWADYLRDALSSYMSSDAVSVVLGRFEATAHRHGSQAAFESLMEAYGNEDTKTAVQKIRSTLELANQTTSIDVNPVTRLREAIKRFNKNIAQCGIELSGVDEKQLSEHQKEGLAAARLAQKHVKLIMPEVCKEKSFESLGTFKGKPAKLQLTVTF